MDGYKFYYFILFYIKHIKHVEPGRQIAFLHDKTTPIYFFTCAEGIRKNQTQTKCSSISQTCCVFANYSTPQIYRCLFYFHHKLITREEILSSHFLIDLLKWKRQMQLPKVHCNHDTKYSSQPTKIITITTNVIQNIATLPIPSRTFVMGSPFF